MCDPQAIALVREIHGLYLQQCTLADRLRGTTAQEPTDHAEESTPERGLLPELQRFSKQEQVVAYRSMIEDPPIRRRLAWAKRVNWTVTFAVCLVLLLRLDSWWIAGTTAALVSCGLLWAQHSFWLRPMLRRNLRQQLTDRGVAICLHCGYDLRGLTSDYCPECGGNRNSVSTTNTGDSANTPETGQKK